MIANPNSYQDQREREIRKRIEKERESRIRSTGAITNTKIKVNKDLASKLQDKKGSTDAETVINDDRFKEMFENPEFAIDEQSHEYKQLNPVKSTKDVSAPALTAAEESDEERLNLNNGVSDHESIRMILILNRNLKMKKPGNYTIKEFRRKWKNYVVRKKHKKNLTVS